MNRSEARLKEPVLGYARKEFPVLREGLSVGEALRRLRTEEIGERIIYFYVVNEAGRLTGVIPTRRLLMSAPETQLGEIMMTNIVVVPHDATLLEAYELFHAHKFLALPVVDAGGHMLGVVDVSLFTEKAVDVAERRQVEDVFQLIGFRVSEIKNKSVLAVFRYRFPWLLATVGSGTVCAILVSAFEATLAEAVILAFFLTLVLGLGESVSMQSMTVTIQRLHAVKPTWRHYFTWLRGELLAAVLLGGACGAAVALIAWGWRGEPIAALAIGISILFSITTACLLGLSIPTLLHTIKEDSKIAAGPVTLAVTDIATISYYFGAATFLLR